MRHAIISAERSNALRDIIRAAYTKPKQIGEHKRAMVAKQPSAMDHGLVPCRGGSSVSL